MPEGKESFELSAVVSLAENVRRQEKELRELRKQLEDVHDEKELKELKKQLEEATKQGKELEELKKQLEQAGRQEKELQSLKEQLELANKEAKELKDQKKEIDEQREEGVRNAKGIAPQLAEVEAMARDARKDANAVAVTSSDSSEVLALAVMGAAQSVEELSAALAKIEERLHEIIGTLEPKGKKSGR